MAQVIYNIDNAKIDEFKVGFLAFVPVPLDIDNNPTMTENEWVKEWGKIQFINAYKKGKMIMAQKAAEITKELIE